MNSYSKEEMTVRRIGAGYMSEKAKVPCTSHRDEEEEVKQNSARTFIAHSERGNQLFDFRTACLAIQGWTYRLDEMP